MTNKKIETEDYLYRLIHALTSSEKTYIKKQFSSKGFREGKHNIDIFNIIENQKEFNIEKLKRKLADKGFAGQIHRTKNYLYHQILRYLQRYHDHTSAEIEINNLIIQIEILYLKACFNECYKLIKKAQALAKKYFYVDKHLSLLKWEQKLILSGLNTQNIEYILILAKEEQKLINTILLIAKVDSIYHDIIIQERKSINISYEKTLGIYKKALHEIHSIRNTDYINDFNVQFLINLISGIYYAYNNKVAKSFEFIKKNISLFEKEPHMQQEQQVKYITSIQNITHIPLGLNDKQMLLLNIENLKNIKPKTPRIQTTLDNTLIFVELNYAITYLDITRGEKCLNQIPNLLKINEQQSFQKNPEYINIIYSSVQFCYLIQDYEQAEKYNNILLNNITKQHFPIMFQFAKLFEILLVYDFDNRMNIENIIHTNSAYLKKHHAIDSFSQLFLSFFSKILRSNNKEKMNIYKEYRTKFIKLSLGNVELFFIQFFVPYWFDSKIENKSFLTILKEKNANLNRYLNQI